MAGLFMFLFIGVNLFNSITQEAHWLTAIIIITLVFSTVQLFFRQRKTKYVLTNSRIIFQLPASMRKTKIQSLPLNHIEDVIFSEGREKNGTITLTLKKSFKTDITTIDIKKNTKRKNPTLEMIEDVEEVSKYIQKGIQGKL